MRKGVVFGIGLVCGLAIAASFLFHNRSPDNAGSQPIVVNTPPLLSSVTPAPIAKAPVPPAISRPAAIEKAPALPAITSTTMSPPVAVARQSSAALPAVESTPPSLAVTPPPSVRARVKEADLSRPPLPLPKAGEPLPGLRDLIIPVDGVRPERLQDTYNQKRDGARPHEALDIMAPRGTPVRATADGKIVKLFDSKPGGLTIYEFDPSQSVAYYYAHLDSYAAGIKEGIQVKQGEVIGYVGTTGNADPNAPHLHFAIFKLGPERHWWQGSPLNPYPLLVTQ
jgi:murein DD-endopeptidase MepM/ murein hydrolase activator NlpD